MTEPLCRCFSFLEMQSATQDFNDAFVIGEGGFGKVYKGFIDNGAKPVAIKRSRSDSRERAHEFWMEIETLTKLRHVHLVSLIGYCNQSKEMILVYEYMPGGTLADHLYQVGPASKKLTWKQRLKICIGAARGLEYLHTGSVSGIIHRDVKDTNILLDENLVAKVSDFGISKLVNSKDSHGYMTTYIKGTYAYLDPHYFHTSRLSKKSDVYAFGVLMLVVLCGRPALDKRRPPDESSLVLWARDHIAKGEVFEIIDQNLMMERITPSDSLKAFAKIAEKCLHQQPRARPTMLQVVASLEILLQEHDEQQMFEQVQPPEPGAASSSSTGEIIHKVGPDEEMHLKSSSLVLRLVTSRELEHDSVPWLWKLFQKTSKPPERHLCVRNTIYEEQSGLVYQGYVKESEDEVSVRRVAVDYNEKKKHNNVKDAVTAYTSQIKNLIGRTHPNLSSLIGFCPHDGYKQLLLVYEYTPGYVSLADFLHQAREDGFHLTGRQCLKICIDAAQGLDFLHTVAGVVHGDLNDSNILLDDNLRGAKVSHFVSPDPIKWIRSTSKEGDVYSFGVVLLAVLTSTPVTDLPLMEYQKDLQLFSVSCACFCLRRFEPGRWKEWKHNFEALIVSEVCRKK